MAKYLLAAHSVEGETREPMSEARVAEVTRQVLEMESEMKTAGVWVFGARLSGPENATVVRTTGDEVVLTDGPFAEAREHLGGFYLLDVADLDEALRWAERTSRLVDSPIEVRSLVEHPGA